MKITDLAMVAKDVVTFDLLLGIVTGMKGDIPVPLSLQLVYLSIEFFFAVPIFRSALLVKAN